MRSKQMNQVQRVKTVPFWSMGFLLIMVSITVFLLHPSLSAAESKKAIYYVSPKGDDSNIGTLKAPWKTIQKAADTLVAGETVFVKEGVYNEFVTVKKSGSEENGYISYKAFPGENPVLDGTGMQIGSGKSALMYLSDASYILVDGFELRNVTTDNPDEFPAGIRVREGGQHIQLLNNNVHHIANNSVDGNAHGIHIYGNSMNGMSDILVKGNEVHHLTLGSSESLTISGNVDGFSIEENRVHHNNNIGIDIAGFYNACEIPCVDQARNGKVVGNVVFNNSSAANPVYEGHYAAGGIYADGATNVTIVNNSVFNNDFGIELASENPGKQTRAIVVRNNVIYQNYGAGLIMGGASSSNGGTSDNRITNNIFIDNDWLGQGYEEITLQWNNVRNEITNNKIYSSTSKLFLQQDGHRGTGNVMKNNRLFSSLVELAVAENEKIGRLKQVGKGE